MSSKKSVMCGGVQIGGGAPISVQSMTNVDTHNIKAAVRQTKQLMDLGCDIMRIAVPDKDAALAFGEIKKQLPDVPIVADIHFDYELAIAAIDNGADAVRINPGNIGSESRVRAVVWAARRRGIPLRIGVNSGSLEKDILDSMGMTADALAESAMRNVELVEKMDFDDIVISVKCSDVQMTFDAYKKVAAMTDHPLHIGVTEAGTYEEALMKSAVGLGGLIMSGIGDTMRVSITGDPAQEPSAAIQILEAAGARQKAINFVSCPTCGRTKVDLAKIAEEVEKRLSDIAKQRKEDGKRPITVAVMGCEVNGPGEASQADAGVACGENKGLLFAHGESIRTVPADEIADALVDMVSKLD